MDTSCPKADQENGCIDGSMETTATAAILLNVMLKQGRCEVSDGSGSRGLNRMPSLAALHIEQLQAPSILALAPPTQEVLSH